MLQADFDIVRINMLNMLKYSKNEYNQYKKTGNIVYLQQAGNKLFNVIENYIQLINRVRAESFYEIKNLVREKKLRHLLYDARTLHRFFYNSELEMNIEDAEELYISVLSRTEQRIKRLDIGMNPNG